MTRMLSPATTATAATPHALPGHGVGRARAVSGAVSLLLAWQERAFQRHALAQLDERALADIGVARTAARNEAAKPFWQA